MTTCPFCGAAFALAGYQNFFQCGSRVSKESKDRAGQTQLCAQIERDWLMIELAQAKREAHELARIIRQQQLMDEEMLGLKDRIRRLEEAGDKMFPWAERVGQEFWTKAKEHAS
jgi:hypothetical protein